MIESNVALKWKLKSLLEQAEVNPHQLAVQMRIAPSSIYRLLRDDGPENFNRKTLNVILNALHVLTSQEFQIGDLIEYEKESS